MNTKFLNSTPILIVTDLVKAKNFYVDKLGFDVSFEWGEPLTYLGVELNNVEIHLNASTNSPREAGQGIVSIFTDEVDNLYENLVSNNVEITIEPSDREYGLRDFGIKDLDGNIIYFGCDIS